MSKRKQEKRKANISSQDDASSSSKDPKIDLEGISLDFSLDSLDNLGDFSGGGLDDFSFLDKVDNSGDLEDLGDVSAYTGQAYGGAQYLLSKFKQRIDENDKEIAELEIAARKVMELSQDPLLQARRKSRDENFAAFLKIFTEAFTDAFRSEPDQAKIGKYIEEHSLGKVLQAIEFSVEKDVLGWPKEHFVPQSNEFNDCKGERFNKAAFDRIKREVNSIINQIYTDYFKKSITPPQGSDETIAEIKKYVEIINRASEFMSSSYQGPSKSVSKNINELDRVLERISEMPLQPRESLQQGEASSLSAASKKGKERQP